MRSGKSSSRLTRLPGRQTAAKPEREEFGNLSLDWRKRAVFVADLEPSQMNRFDCRLEKLDKRAAPQLKPVGDSITLKTADLEVSVNTRTGLIDTYRVGGVDYITGRAFEPLVIKDNEDPWGMTSHSFRDVEGSFKLMSAEDGTKFSGVKAVIPSVRVIEDGAVRAVIEAVFEYGRSAICQRYMLPKHGTEIEVHTRVHWNEKDRMLKLSIPTTASPLQGGRGGLPRPNRLRGARTALQRRRGRGAEVDRRGNRRRPRADLHQRRHLRLRLLR